MSDVFRDPNTGWVAVLVVLLPIVIIGTGELEERLRQRDSHLGGPIAILRTWVLPLFAVWALLLVLFAPDDANPLRVAVATALVLALGAAALAALQIIVAGIRDRPRDGRRQVPRLLLAFPRLVLILVIAWILIAGVWNVDLSAALTALGVTSLVVSFALQDTLGGIASGFALLADQPFQVGDWICSGELEGRVIDINWRSSRIQTRDGDLVVVPNGQLASGSITNFDEPTRLHRVVMPVQVAYVNSPTDARGMLLAAARSTPGVLAEPPPNAVVVQVDDPLMGYEVHMWVDDYTIAPRVRSEFGALVWYHSHRRGVPLPSPAQDLFLWDGERASASGQRDRASLLRGLRRSPLIDQLDDDDLDDLLDGATADRFAAGESILGGDPDELAVVESGVAEVQVGLDDGRSESVVELSVGDVLMGFDPAETRGHDVTVVAVGDCDVIRLRPEAAGRVLSRAPALTTAIEQLATGRLRRLHRAVRRAERDELVAGGDGLPADVDDAGPVAQEPVADADGHDGDRGDSLGATT